MNADLIKKIVLLLLATGLAGLFFAFDLHSYLTLNYLKESQEHFSQLYDQSPMLVIASYMVIYILVTALSLPGAVILTLAGGALFGLSTGLLLVSFASTIGATLACFVARFVLRDWVQKKFGDKLTTINEGIDREGAFYLFTLRLIPVFPFFVINLVLGLTPMRLTTFYWVSQLGMLPGTVVFVNAGKELAKVQSPGDILSLSLLVSFALLGLMPLIIKKSLNVYKKTRASER